MILNNDWREFIESLNSHRVKYALIGGHAVAHYGQPRFTDDLDCVIERTPENVDFLLAALTAFGFGSLGLTAKDFLEPDQVIQLGLPPYRIDLITSVSGVDDGDLWEHRSPGEWDGLSVWWIGRETLVRNKRATGRPKDIVDLGLLGEDTDER